MSNDLWINNLKSRAENDGEVAKILLSTFPGFSAPVVGATPGTGETYAISEIFELLSGRKIAAIRDHRLRTGKGLRDSKDAIDRLDDRIGKFKRSEWGKLPGES